MAPIHVDFGELERPSDRAVSIEHGVPGRNLVPAIAVEVNRARLVSSLIAAGIPHMPEQLARAAVGVDIVVTVLDEDIGGPTPAREIGKRDAVGGVVGDSDAASLLTRPAIEFDDSALGGQDDFKFAVAVPVMNLARDIVMPFFSPDVGVAPSPKDRTVEFVGYGRGRVVYVADIVVYAGNEFDFAVRIEVGSDDPLTAVVGIEGDNLPRLNGGDTRWGRARIVGIEEQGFGGARGW